MQEKKIGRLSVAVAGLSSEGFGSVVQFERDSYQGVPSQIAEKNSRMCASPRKSGPSGPCKECGMSAGFSPWGRRSSAKWSFPAACFKHAKEQALTGFSRCERGLNSSGSRRLHFRHIGIAEAMP
jgi:hypothetical protein